MHPAWRRCPVSQPPIQSTAPRASLAWRARLTRILLVLALVWPGAQRLAAQEAVTHFAGIWEAGGGPEWVARHNLTAGQFQSAFNTFFSQGFRLIHVSGYAAGGNEYYAGLWDKSAGPAWAARHAMTAAQYQSAFTDLANQGYRLAEVTGFEVAGEARFAAIWRQTGTAAWTARHNLTTAQFESTSVDLLGQGYRPLWVNAYTVGGVVYYAGIWDKSASAAWVIRHGLSADEYRAALLDLTAQGYRLRVVSGCFVGGQERFAALFDKNASPGWVTRQGLDSAGYQAAVNELVAANYRLVYVNGYGDAGAPGPVPDLVSAGVPVPELQAFDDAMKRFMGARHIPGGVLCVARGGRIVFDRAYGFSDAVGTLPLRPSALFRIASLTKPLTATAIRQLAAAGQLSLSDHVFNLGQPGGGRLTLTPAGVPDSRLRDITVQQVLDHVGGWDRDLSGDPMFSVNQISQSLGLTGLPTPADIARYMMGRKLDHAPGTTYAYSNFGYLLLGLVIEQVTGEDYLTHLRRTVLRPAGVADADVELGRSLPAARNPREPHYADPNVAPNVFQPAVTVPFPDGGFYLEDMTAHGALIATARAYTQFLLRNAIDGAPYPAANPPDETFFGSLPGTWTLGRQRPDGVSYAAFFNQREDASGLGYDSIVNVLDAAAVGVVSWPAGDPRDLPVPRPVLNPQGLPGGVGVPGESGRIYQLQQSPDLRLWRDAGPPVVGAGRGLSLVPVLSQPLPPAGIYFRVAVE